MAQKVGGLHGKAKPWVSAPALHKPGVLVHMCPPSMQGAEARRLRVQRSSGYITNLKTA